MAENGKAIDIEVEPDGMVRLSRDGREHGCYPCDDSIETDAIRQLFAQLTALKQENEALRAEAEKFDRIKPEDIDRIVLAGLRKAEMRPRQKANARMAIVNGLYEYFADIDDKPFELIAVDAAQQGGK